MEIILVLLQYNIQVQKRLFKEIWKDLGSYQIVWYADIAKVLDYIVVCRKVLIYELDAEPNFSTKFYLQNQLCLQLPVCPQHIAVFLLWLQVKWDIITAYWTGCK